MAELSLYFDDHPSETSLDDFHGLLFGDVPLAAWKPCGENGADGEPWISFATARAAVELGNAEGAVAALHRVVGSRHLDARHYLQAWHFLRELGESPPVDEAKRVYGVVIEVHLDVAVDTLSAYSDPSARYLGGRGKLLVCDDPTGRNAALVDRLLDAGQRVANLLAPSEEPRRAAPPRGHARITMLTPSGLHFDEGPFDVLRADPMGGPVIAAGTRLLHALTAAAG
jgi:hypothetical protein